MNTSRIIYRIPFKLLAIVLSVLCILGMTAGLAYGFITYSYGSDSNNGGTSFYQSARVQEHVNGITYMLADSSVHEYLSTGEYYPNDYLDPSRTNLRFEIYKELKDGTTELLPLSTYHQEPSGYSTMIETHVWTSEYSYHKIQIWAYLTSPLTVDDEFMEMKKTWSELASFGQIPYYAAGGCALLFILLQIYLVCAAGHKRTLEAKDEIVQGGLHLIPFDVLLLALPFILLLFWLIWNEGLDRGSLLDLGSAYSQRLFYLELGLLGAFASAIYGIALFYLMSFAIRVKKKNLFSGMLIVRLFRWIGRGLRKCADALPLIWREVFVAGIVTLILLILMGIFSFSYAICAFLVLVVFAGVVIYLVQEGLVQKGRQRAVASLASGDLMTPVSVQAHTKEDRQEIEDLSKIHNTVQMAVNRQLQSERMKTELITNVSHDIKTPLTSIINYVDLLKKEGEYSEKQLEYLGILEKQSDRLKKLIEDLIEASKAASGNIQVHMMRISLGEMVRQMAGEYTERFEKAGLGLEMDVPEEEIPVLADGRLLSRVLDNLLGNALKYSQPGTRVYLDIAQGESMATVSIRNISKAKLNISEEELMERFVRGDESRHTEGSGLGLGIARSLTEMMGGRFRIQIDGDLFKAHVSIRKDNA